MNRIALGALILCGPLILIGCDQGTKAAMNPLASTTASEASQSMTVPLRTTLSAELSSCDNSPGPFITLSGQLTAGSVGARLTFTNNLKGTHTFTDETERDVVVIPAGQSITIPKQPSQGGVGGNPFIWIQLLDDQGKALTDEIFLGRCVQGTTADAAADIVLAAVAHATITADSCTNNPGPYITFGGNLVLSSGVTAKFIFRNNDNPVGGPHEADVLGTVSVRIVPPGVSIVIPKQPVLGGVGGNPWIFLQFLTAAGMPIGDQVLIGRCVQLT